MISHHTELLCVGNSTKVIVYVNYISRLQKLQNVFSASHIVRARVLARISARARTHTHTHRERERERERERRIMSLP